MFQAQETIFVITDNIRRTRKFRNMVDCDDEFTDIYDVLSNDIVKTN